MSTIGAFSKYRIMEKLGAGGMGEVYKGEDLALLRTAAIKVMFKQVEGTSGEATRFLLHCANTASRC